MRTIIVYVPVLHRGYTDLFDRYPDAPILLIGKKQLIDLGTDESLRYVAKKDLLRAVPEQEMYDAIRGMYPGRTVGLVSPGMEGEDIVVMPDEDISRAYADAYLAGSDVRFEQIFLRYDRTHIQRREDALAEKGRVLEQGSFEAAMLHRAFVESAKSWDWWRQVGAVLAKDGAVLLWTCNQHMPDEQWPYAFGDPRSLFKSGEILDVATAQHAESRLVGEAARRGLSTDGADLFITAFPCGPCMMHVGSAGVRRVFYVEGSYGLNTPEIMQYYGIEAVRVQF